MKITKYGHCCMLIEENGLRLLTDPGNFTLQEQEALDDLDVILFTHEHHDHFHLDSLKKILAKNPQAIVLCNTSVADILSPESIEFSLLRDTESFDHKGVTIEGIGTTHAPIHTSMPPMANTGFFIGRRLWYPGDSFVDPKRPVELLALPVAGPWMKTQEAIDYAIALKPAKTFPVHDAILNPVLLQGGAFGRWYGSILEKHGIPFESVELARAYDF